MQQMHQRCKEVCEELERRSRPSGGSCWGPDKFEQLEEREAEELQQMTEELEALELQMAAVHPKVGKELQRL